MTPRLAKDAQDPIVDLIMKTLEEHEENFDPQDMKDFLDLTISELKANKVIAVASSLLQKGKRQ